MSATALSTAPPADHSIPSETSQPRPLIYDAMPKVAQAIGTIGKDQVNSYDKYKFRGIDDLYNAVGPALARVGVTMTHQLDWHTVEQRESSKGTTMFHVVLQQTTRFSAADGSHVETQTIGEAMDRGDKAYNKAMSAATKYALLRTFAIPTEDSEDADAESHQVAAPKAKGKRQSKAKLTADQLAAIESWTVEHCQSYTSAIDKGTVSSTDAAVLSKQPELSPDQLARLRSARESAKKRLDAKKQPPDVKAAPGCDHKGTDREPAADGKGTACSECGEVLL